MALAKKPSSRSLVADVISCNQSLLLNSSVAIHAVVHVLWLPSVYTYYTCILGIVCNNDIPTLMKNVAEVGVIL